MDRKLWTEARAIAARRDPRGADDLAQDLACAMLEKGAQAACCAGSAAAPARMNARTAIILIIRLTPEGFKLTMYKKAPTGALMTF